WTSMANAFAGCQNLNITNPNIDAPNLAAVRDMSGMFQIADRFNGDLTDWDVGNVEDMSAMFDGIDGTGSNVSGLSNWDVSNVRSMANMFRTSSIGGDLRNWDVSKVRNMSGMFGGAVGSFSGLGAWDVGNVEDMSNMFAGVTDFNQDISAWNVGKVEDMSGMFVSTLGFNQNLGAWDVSQVEDMSAMFEGAQAFDQDLGSWNVGQVQDMSRMFANTALSNNNYDALLMGWSTQTLQAGVVFDAGNSRYCVGGPARAVLVAAPNNWTITDAGGVPNCAPVAICQDVTVQLDATGAVVVDAAAVNNNSTSIAPPLTFTLSPSVFNCDDLGENPVVLTITDGNGNSSSCNATVTVVDDIAPSLLNCPENATREINLPALSYLVLGSELDPTAEDNCSVSSLTNNITGTGTLAGAELPSGLNEISWTATDNSGNTANCTTQVTIEYPASDYFITTWQTTSPNESITIPTTGGGYDYTVDWGDGTVTTNHAGNATHSYATAGVHTVRIIGAFPRIFFNFSGDRNKIVTVEQWGNI
ncbi:MAG: BspA family leucine-rich repeat surface protein, partial [Bacteroidota bacterium]